MKKILAVYIVLTTIAMGCNSSGGDEHHSTQLLVASKYGYVVGGDMRPIPMPIIQVVNDDGGEKWETTQLIGVELLNYEDGYEYTIRAHKESYMPEDFPEYKDVLWWKVDEILNKVKKESNLPDDVFVYTYGSPWGFDPRDPLLELMLEHYKEIFGEDAEIYYPTK